jgi:hypothetical protein
LNDEDHASPSEPAPEDTEWNWVIIARGTEELFKATKGLINASGGRIKYQKPSGYLFRVEEMRPDNHAQTSTEKGGAGR